MFGVYLIHDNNLIRHFLWIDLFKNSTFYKSQYLIYHASSAVLLVFIVCIIIDQLRYIFIEKPFFNLITTRLKKCSDIFNILKRKNYTLANKALERTR